jgi:preprotein translocase subunit SecE
VKLGAALALMIVALAAFYYFADVSKLARVLGLLAAVGLAAALALQTERGRTLASFVKDSQTEVRKVVWPTRQETVQTTLIVMIVVVIIAMFLWLLDMALGGIVSWTMGHKG